MNCLQIKAIARFIIDEGATVRMAADVFGCSKTSIHHNVTKELKEIDLELSNQVQEVLKRNKAERHIRGGIATRKTWQIRKMKENN